MLVENDDFVADQRVRAVGFDIVLDQNCKFVSHKIVSQKVRAVSGKFKLLAVECHVMLASNYRCSC